MNSSHPQPTGASEPPPAQGIRLDWSVVPAHIRATVEKSLGSTVVRATSQASGFSPGVAARLRLENGRRVFVKAISPAQNPTSPAIHRREAQIVAALPDDVPVPRLLWVYDEENTGWVVLLFEDIEGRTPAQPWRADELDRVINALVALSDRLTPSVLSAPIVDSAGKMFTRSLCGWQKLQEQQSSHLNTYRNALDAWSLRHLDALAALESTAAAGVDGDTLLHFDIRADNVLLTPERVWFVDWPHACRGAAWIDILLFAPSVTMQGGPLPGEILARHPTSQNADPAAITAAVIALAGYFTYNGLQPPPPGLPTLRAFQAAQGAVARAWVSQRTGWT